MSQSRTELLRIIEEMKSERDAAKRDTLAAIEERNRALDEVRDLWTTAAKICRNEAAISSPYGAAALRRVANEFEKFTAPKVPTKE